MASTLRSGLAREGARRSRRPDRRIRFLERSADDKTVGDLIRDLGSDEYSVRERAESDLRKMGDAAIPALREALEDKDPGRALRAHRMLGSLEKKGRHSDEDRRLQSRTWTAYRDFGRGITWETHPDGKVELTVRGPGADGAKKETRTYQADSLEDFKKKYPELAAEYDVDNLAPKEKWSFLEDSKDSWEAWKKGFDKEWVWDKDKTGKFAPPWFPFGFGALHPWLPDPLKQLEELRKIGPEESRDDSPGKPQLGIVVERVPTALSDQLGLGADEGLVITEVRASSAAERAGLRKHDILLKVKGKALTGPEELRRDVKTGFQKGMELDVLRRGKCETVRIEAFPSPSK